GPIIHVVDKTGTIKTTRSLLQSAPFKNIVVLVDKRTASAAEIIAAALQDSKAGIVVGETTYGKGVIQSIFMLPNGGGIKLTTDEYLTRNKKNINNIGITPDIILEKPPADLLTENDWQLNQAIEILIKSK
ncbi:MAG: S41 family peptidase, partial [Defluviitaleaceae bacterium]|nr:S41 family peptidase [Defluviitaleaceae bacterium]